MAPLHERTGPGPLAIGPFVQRVLLAFLAVIVVVGLWAARGTLMSGFAAAVLAVAISLPAGWLQRRGLPRGWAIAASAVVLFGVVAALFLLVVPRLVADLTELATKLPRAAVGLGDAYAGLRAGDEFWGAVLPPLDADGDGVRAEQIQALFRRAAESGFAVAGSLAAALAHFGLIVFVALFFVIDPTAYVRGGLYLLPRRHHARVVHLCNELYATVRVWLTTLGFSVSVTIALVWAILGLGLGMPNALAVAVFAGVATFIPNIGAFLPIIPIVVFGLASGDPARVLLYVPVYLGIQLFESNVLTPAIVKSQLDIPAGLVLLFQLVITLAFGALGLLLAVPLLAVLIVVVRELYSYQMLGLHRLRLSLTTDGYGRLRLDEGETERPAGPLPPLLPDEVAPSTDLEEALATDDLPVPESVPTGAPPISPGSSGRA